MSPLLVLWIQKFGRWNSGDEGLSLSASGLSSHSHMNTWQPRPRDRKRYRHFDAPLTDDAIIAIANDPERVARNAFFPLIGYDEKQYRFRGVSPKPAPKKRPLRYASRRDAAIYARYRVILSERYESLLALYGISDIPIAYRKLADAKCGGKYNVHFAEDAIQFIKAKKLCAAVVLDINSFFDKLGHTYLMQQWNRLMGSSTLSPDHRALFKAVTQFVVIDRDKLYEYVGILRYENGRRIFLKPKNGEPRQLFEPRVFRDFMKAAKSPSSGFILAKGAGLGIPQGLPISDILANVYMRDFDLSVSSWAKERGGFYRRYSDDIICILPGGEAEVIAIRDFIRTEIAKCGGTLSFKDEKISGITFQPSGNSLVSSHVTGKAGKNGLEYLGFRFDGKSVYLRDKTISNMHRKFVRRASGACRNFVARFEGKSETWILENFPYEKFLQNFFRVERFHEIESYDNWTCWTYARLAEKVMQPHSPRIFQQLQGLKKRARPFLEKKLRSSYAASQK